MGWIRAAIQRHTGAQPNGHQSHQCAGFPADHICPVIVPVEDTWCRDCRERRQAAIAAGVPPSGMLPIGIVLEDFQAPVLECKCGGNPTMPDHRHSLLHLQWEWKQGRRTGGRYLPPVAGEVF